MADSLSIDTVICGRFEHHGMSVMVTENTPPTLGMAFLVRYVVTMDFPKREMWLRPSRRFGDRELVDLSGLCLMKDAERIIVAVVIPQSPAFIADVQAGDELMSVGRRKASELRLHEMRLMLCEPDRTVPIEFQRDGKPSEVGLRLKQWW